MGIWELRQVSDYAEAGALTLGQRRQSPIIWGTLLSAGDPMAWAIRETGGTKPVCSAPSIV